MFPPRWHDASCLGRDIRVSQFDHSPYCMDCGSTPPSVRDESTLSVASNHRPRIPSYSALRLEWPPSVSYVPDETQDVDEIPLPLASTETMSVDQESIRKHPPAFEYDALEEPDEIRILTLSEGEGEDALHGTLSKHRLQDCTPYEAVSYTWGCFDTFDEHYGDTSKSEVIYLDKFWDSFPITRNCRNALRRLRHSDRTRSLWIDAICINQESRDEQSHQVKLMHQIFGNATAVAAYLGAASPDSDLAMELVGQPHRLMDKLTEIEYSSIESLFQRPYFKRIWIVQEVALARSLYFYCGSSEAFFHLILEAPFESRLWPNATPAWLYLQRQRSLQGENMASLLGLTLSCKYSDPRDRIFALLGLAASDQQQKLVPDYNLSVEQLYTGVASFFLMEDNCSALDILRLAANSAPHSLASLPSWVPRWTRESVSGWKRSTAYQADSSSSEDEHFQLPRGSTNTGRLASRIPRDEATMNNFWLNAQVSSSGRLIVQGLLLSRYLSKPHIAKDKRLDYEAETFIFDREPMGQSHLKRKDHPVPFMLLDYSTVLLLCPVEGTDFFRFVDVGRILVNRDRVSFPYPKEFSLLPLTASEQALVNGTLSKPQAFPFLQDCIGLWKPESRDWIDEHCILPPDLLDADFGRYHENDVRFWDEWKDYRRKGTAILQSRAHMDSLLDSLRSLEQTGDLDTSNDRWKKFIGMAESETEADGCGLAAFLGMFILDPCEAAPQHTLRDEAPDGIEDSTDGPLELFRDWMKLTFDYLEHMTHRDSRTLLARFNVPGRDTLAAARRVWDHHTRVASVVRGDQPAWAGWDAVFMARKIKRQRVEGESVGVSRGYGRFSGEAYWDWTTLETAVETRLALWPELIRLQEALREEWSASQVDIKEMQEKIAGREVMREVFGEFSDLQRASVTIV